MAELEKTVSNLTSEHSSLMKQNRELTIRLETLETRDINVRWNHNTLKRE